jgi:hypothetical protein
LIYGTATDSATGEPLPFIQIGFQGTSIFTLSDEKGKYTLTTDSPRDSLTAASLGYITSKAAVKKGEKQKIDFRLVPQVSEIKDIFLFREEPEIRLIKRVVKNKKNNRKENAESYDFQAYEKVKIGDKDYEKTRKKWFIPKPFKFFFNNVDTTSEAVYLPLLIVETVKKSFIRNQPKAEKEEIVSIKMSGLKNESLSRIFDDRTLSAYIYDNYLNFFNKNFISPAADFALNHYKYKIEDTVEYENQKCIIVSFVPKHKQELTFRGTMYILDSVYAVKKISARIAKDANINFISDLGFDQEYIRAGQKVWLVKEEVYHIHGNVNIPGLGDRNFYGSKYVSYKNQQINQPHPADFYKQYGEYEYAPEAVGKPREYWDTARHRPLTYNDQRIYDLTDSLKNMRLFKNSLFLFTGYKTYKGFQFGPYFSFYSYNPVEGNRFRIGVRSTPLWSKKWYINSYLAYGTRDNRFKYSAGLQYFFKKMPRNQIGIIIKEDIAQFTWSQNYYRTQETVVSTLFKISSSNKLILNNEIKLFYEKEWKEGFMNRIQIRRNAMFPLRDIVFEKNTETGTVLLKDITTTEISLLTHYGIKEKYVVGDYRRTSLGSAYPIFDLILVQGIKGIAGGDYNFSRAIFSVRHRLKTGHYGYLRYRFETGKIWGSLPYPLLELHNGNQTFFYDELSFNTMNFLEFASDQYASLALTHNFEGYFFNKIPLVRKLKWREVISGKALIGGLSSSHSKEMVLPANLYRLTDPFAEAGFGIDNIFKVIRVDFLWRLTYRDHPAIDRFKILGSLHISF